MHRGFTISHVKKESPAAKAGIKAGDFLFKINNSFFYDILDYHYLCSGQRVLLSLYNKKGNFTEIKIKKKYDEELGLDFFSPTLGPIRRCQNHCLFCFIDQQSPGMRSSLYEKDDDYRLSFFHGNYITLTNMGDLDLKRIVRRGISPLYVSIHSTDPVIRRKMMGNVAAGVILEQLKKLVRGGVEIHGQVVVCPGLNDGAVLKKTVKDLSLLYPGLKTVALVPVGLTRYRQKLAPLRSVSPGEACSIVEDYSAMQELFQEQLGTPFIYLADEFYILSGRLLPPHEHYGMYQQLENGVGLGRLFLNEIEEWRKSALPSLRRKMEISLVTGQSGGAFLKMFLGELEKIRGLKTYLHILPNVFWGGNVTVTGLLTGSDLLLGLSRENLGEVMFIPSVMLKEGTKLFLDNISLDFLAARLKVRIVPVNSLEEIRSFFVKKVIPVTG
jgi:putative radical SAM enzyme (TIGR03279 family)